MRQSHSTLSPEAIASDSAAEARVSILDAAESLFCLHGVDGVSVRDITKSAHVNLGAINYYFGTKDRLALEVFARRLEPINRQRIARLDALEAATVSRKPKIKEIIDALIRPAVEVEGHSPRCDDFMRLISRSFQEPNPELKKFVETQFAEVAERFDAAMLRAVPTLSPDELFWRMHFCFGALHHGQEMWLRFEQMPRPQRRFVPVRPDREGFIQRIVAFVAAGFAAPLPAPEPRPSIKTRSPVRRNRSGKSES